MIGRHFPQTGHKRTREETDLTEASEEASTSQLENTTPTTPESGKNGEIHQYWLVLQ